MNTKPLIFVVINLLFTFSVIANEHQDLFSEYQLGLQYLQGKSVKKDLVLGRTIIENVAENNLAEAKYTLAFLYNKGIGGNKNKQKSLSLIKAQLIKDTPKHNYI